MEDSEAGPADIVKFWREAGPDRWFFKDESFDAEFRGRFLEQHMAAARRQCDHWANSAEGALALMILLDQLPRNCFRGTGHMYATDPLARHFAGKAIDAGFDMEFDEEMRVFFYLPFEHSEHLEDQRYSVEITRERAEEYPNTRWTTSTSSSASGASRTATRCWEERPRRRSRRFWMAADSQARA
jgi:uncharacterized protein (DUF924 family)